MPPFPPGARVVAIGIDLADGARIRAVLLRDPDRFIRRVLTNNEAAYCFSRPDPAPHVAARFAAKEAVIKCLGGGCALRDIEIVRGVSGAPGVLLSGRAASRAGSRRVLVSLSHLDTIAAAFAVLVDGDDTP